MQKFSKEFLNFKKFQKINFKILKTSLKKFERKEKFLKKFFEKSGTSQKNFKILKTF